MVEEFKIELAVIEDMKDVFELSNEKAVRENSFNQEKIEWEDHQRWFKNKINDKNCAFYLIKNVENILISQVRFDKIDKQEGDISISISPQFRGKGYGAVILRALSEKITKEQCIRKINAYVKNNNIASKIVFEKAGYLLKETDSQKARYEYNAK